MHPKDRFLFREIIFDENLISPSSRDAFEETAIFIDEQISDHYRLQSEEAMLLLKPLLDTKLQVSSATDPAVKAKILHYKERLDHEYWFLRKLNEIAPDGGFSEVSREYLQMACIPRASRASRVKTYVDPADYEVLRVWTRGLHPACMYPIDRSLKSRPSATEIPSKNDTVNKWINRLTNILTPKALPVVPKDDLCYGHVLVAYRLKGDSVLHLRMMKHVPVSPTAGNSHFAEGVIDILPEHRFVGLSQAATRVVLASASMAVAGLCVLTPIAYLMGGGLGDPELILSWSFSAACTAGITAALVSLRYWKARADWSERLRKLSLNCEFNSGTFALAHLLGLVQSELFKSSLLVYALLLKPSAFWRAGTIEGGAPLKRSQLEIRAESWIAKRLSPHSHINLPASAEKPSIRRRAPSTSPIGAEEFNGGSGPFFDLQFDAGPALQLLRQLCFVRGTDEEGLEATAVKPTDATAKRLSPFLSPDCQEDDLGSPRVVIRQ
ncbi:unnamed protein product [Mesocestoides corti]|uniref:Transmembrane protein n=1 Tax=Mesocestoides corti TaxID=53468 RepID=A0A0R3UNH3_MESCO|nr:unnamed protein product [Mesocestoides corti]